MCFVSNHLKKLSIVVWYSDQYVIILRFFLYFKSATHFKILKFIHFFFSVRHRGYRDRDKIWIRMAYRSNRDVIWADEGQNMNSDWVNKTPWPGFESRKTVIFVANLKSNGKPSSKYSQLLEKDSKTEDNVKGVPVMAHAGGRRFFDRWV